MSRPVPSLTTVWTPECSSIFHFYETSTKSCLPPEYDAVWDNNGYYSPGICFSGYTSGCSPTWYNDIEPGETAAHCVPSGFGCHLNYYATNSNENMDTIIVPAFEVRWRESDLSLLETPPLTPGANPTDNPESGSRTEPTARPTEDPEPGSDESDNVGVSTGAVAGIAVGVAVLVAALCAAAFVMYRRRHRKTDGGATGDTPAEVKSFGGLTHGQPSEIGTSSYLGATKAPGVLPTELAGAHYYSADGAVELHGQDVLPELPHAGVDSNPAGVVSPARVTRKPVLGEAAAGT